MCEFSSYGVSINYSLCVMCTHICAGVCVYMYVVCLLMLCLLKSKADVGREEPLLTAGKNVDNLKWNFHMIQLSCSWLYTQNNFNVFFSIG